MHKLSARKSALSLAVIAAASVSTSSLHAQQPVLEEVTVTAQLREESLQDVPVSVSAVSGAKIKDFGIDKIEDLQAYVPNLSFSETGIGTNIYIRGIGSGINQGFEQSVGMYVDGVYHGRAQLARAPFLDLQRVEVLRGPQNILYGKNSIAGAMSIVTAEPTDEFEGLVSALYEPEHDEQVYDVVLSGPLTDNFGARLAYRNRSMDGYIDNLTLNRDEPERDEETVRLKLNWQPTEDLETTLKLEHSEFDVTGRQVEIIRDQTSLNPAFGGLGLNYSGALVGLFGADPSALNTTQDYKRSSGGDFSDNETDNITLTVNYAMGDYQLTSITAHLEYEYDELCDCDFSGADVFSLSAQEEYEQFSQEFRIASPTGGPLEWIAGLYYQDSELDFGDNFNVSQTSVLPNVLDTLLPVAFANPAPPPATFYPAGAAQQLRGINVPRTFEQDTEVWSIFGQLTWSVTDALRLSAGARYSSEEKDGYRSLTVLDANGNLVPYDPRFIPGTYMGIDYLLSQVFKMTRHDGTAAAPGLYPVAGAQQPLSGSRDEDKFAPLLQAEFDINDEVMVYASWSQGFKSGGFDARSNTVPQPFTISNPFSPLFNVTVPAGSFEYEDEEAVTYEIGAKTTWLNGRAELNAALFRTEYDDLQISIFDGIVGFNVGNAAEATTQGLELDGRWAATPHLTLSGSVAFLDFEFDDFETGQCTQAVRIATGNIICDASGESNQYVADWSGVVSADYHVPLGDSLQLRTVLDVIFTDDYNPTQNLDPLAVEDGYTKLNARVAVSDPNDTWEVALVGRNLTDEEIVSYANDTPLAANLFQSIGHYAIIERERTVAIQGLYRF